MNLIIDQGNTVTKVAIFRDNILIATFSYKMFTVEDCSLLMADYSFDKCIFSAVQKPSVEVLSYLNNKIAFFLFINENTALPINNAYKTPQSLGTDRLAAVVGANALYPAYDVLVIDLGTAITYEFIDKQDCYHGGNISPGLSMRFQALHSFTGKLPLVDMQGEQPVIGYDTQTAIRAGVIHGVVLEINGYIHEYRRKYPNIVIVLTGGDTDSIESQLDKKVVIDRNLVPKGLNRIVEYNGKK